MMIGLTLYSFVSFCLLVDVFSISQLRILSCSNNFGCVLPDRLYTVSQRISCLHIPSLV